MLVDFESGEDFSRGKIMILENAPLLFHSITFPRICVGAYFYLLYYIMAAQGSALAIVGSEEIIDPRVTMSARLQSLLADASVSEEVQNKLA